MALIINNLLAHQETVRKLVHHHQQELFSSTYLFHGPSSVGKKLAARSMAQILLCENSSQGCGECGSCLRMQNNSHEGYLEIAPEGQQIKVEHAKEVLNFLHLQAIQRYRFILIDEAHRLNVQAGNMLLKVLEEPPAQTVFILVTSNASMLLPTLKSRTRQVRFRPLRSQELTSLHAVPSWMLSVSRGQVDRLQELVNGDTVESRQSAVDLLESFLFNKNFLFEKEWRNLLKNKGYYTYIKHFWIELLRDFVLTLNSQFETIRNTDQKSVFSRWASETNQKKINQNLIFTLLQRLILAEQETNLHRDPVLWMEESWILLHTKVSQ